MKIMFFVRFSIARIWLLRGPGNLALQSFRLVEAVVLFQVNSLITAAFTTGRYFEGLEPNLQSPRWNVIELSFKN
jgi:hypothetical protein